MNEFTIEVIIYLILALILFKVLNLCISVLVASVFITGDFKNFNFKKHKLLKKYVEYSVYKWCNKIIDLDNYYTNKIEYIEKYYNKEKRSKIYELRRKSKLERSFRLHRK